MIKVTTFVPWWTGAAVLAAARVRRTSLRRGTLADLAIILVVPPLAAAGWSVAIGCRGRASLC